ncbi:hypothetical protein OPV22_033691 [Ensete ventricosum]|uniref:Uncharacterized protein n=1 Tax=Ensete ventricosum TaxID=4639 RepID=A0AAV8P2H1_ENSVE|nr:hypothetical protein OPV22_033691 [Ensete ventricosum]
MLQSSRAGPTRPSSGQPHELIRQISIGRWIGAILICHAPLPVMRRGRCFAGADRAAAAAPSSLWLVPCLDSIVNAVISPPGGCRVARSCVPRGLKHSISSPALGNPIRIQDGFVGLLLRPSSRSVNRSKAKGATLEESS